MQESQQPLVGLAFLFEYLKPGKKTRKSPLRHYSHPDTH